MTPESNSELRDRSRKVSNFARGGFGSIYPCFLKGLSPELGLFLGSMALHVVLQVLFSALLPFEYFSELSGHDGSVYFELARDLIHDQPKFTAKRYQRPLLPMLAGGLFKANLHLGIFLIGTTAASLSNVYFYKIARRYVHHPIHVTGLYMVAPYIFVGAHLGMSEPLLMVGLLAGYMYARRGELGKAGLGYSLALLSKEIGLFPWIAEIAIQVRRDGVKAAWKICASVIPALGWYLLLAIRWNEPLWMLGATSADLGLAPLEIIELIARSGSQSAYPASFVLVNQAGNVIMLVLIAAALFALRGRSELVAWTGASAAPLMLLGPAVVTNWDFGRQAVPALLLLLAVPDSMLRPRRPIYWLTVAALLGVSIFWTLFFARFFAYY